MNEETIFTVLTTIAWACCAALSFAICGMFVMQAADVVSALWQDGEEVFKNPALLIVFDTLGTIVMGVVGVLMLGVANDTRIMRV